MVTMNNITIQEQALMTNIFKTGYVNGHSGIPKPLIIKEVSFYTECEISFNHLFIKTISNIHLDQSMSGVSKIKYIVQLC